MIKLYMLILFVKTNLNKVLEMKTMKYELKRPSGRNFDELRKITMKKNTLKHAEGSCLIKFGNTHVIFFVF